MLSRYIWKAGTPVLSKKIIQPGIYLFYSRTGDIGHAIIEFRERSEGNGSFIAIDVDGDVRELVHNTDFTDVLGIGEIIQYYGPVDKPKKGARLG